MILIIFFWHLISGRKCVTSVSSNFTTIHAIWKYKCVIHLFDSLLISIFFGYIYYAYSLWYYIFNVDNMFMPFNLLSTMIRIKITRINIILYSLMFSLRIVIVVRFQIYSWSIENHEMCWCFFKFNVSLFALIQISHFLAGLLIVSIHLYMIGLRQTHLCHLQTLL